MFICIRILKHWRLSLVQVRNVYWLLEFSLSTRRERERERNTHTHTHTQFLLCWPFHLTQQTRGATRRPQMDWPRPGSKINWPRQEKNLNSLLFQKSPKFQAPCFRAWRHSNPCLISYLGFLLWNLWLSHPPRASVNCTQYLHVHVH